MANFRKIGTNFTEGLRTPHYTNGRLLTAEDLREEQQYHVERHADLGQAAGYGIVEGFRVTAVSGNRALTITAGLGLNQKGAVVQLTGESVTLLIEPVRQEAAPLDRSSRFIVCTTNGDPDNAPVTEDGAYLLTARPAAQFEGSVPRRSCDGTDTPTCANQWEVEGVEFRIIRLTSYIAPRGNQQFRNRNLLAHYFFGSDEIVDLMLDPFSFPANYTGFSELSAEDFNDCDLPLAVFYWDNRRVDFVDEWAVRRRLMHPYPAANWAANISDQRKAEGEARYLQFQQHIADLQAQFGSRTNSVSAVTRFAYLPPVGFLPVNPFDLILTDTFVDNLSKIQLRSIVANKLTVTKVFDFVRTVLLRTYSVTNAYSLPTFFGNLLPRDYLIVHEDLVHDRLHQSFVQPPIQLSPPPDVIGKLIEVVQTDGMVQAVTESNVLTFMDSVNRKFSGDFYNPKSAVAIAVESVEQPINTVGVGAVETIPSFPTTGRATGAVAAEAVEINVASKINNPWNPAMEYAANFNKVRPILGNPWEPLIPPKEEVDDDEETDPLIQIMVVSGLLDPYKDQLEKEISARIDDAIVALSSPGGVFTGSNRYSDLVRKLNNNYTRSKFLSRAANYGYLDLKDLGRYIQRSVPPTFYVVFARYQPRPIPRPLRVKLEDLEGR